ncbi:MAG TPA: hypothetical protein VER32_15710 [Pyrinomonadaceae bacterium]|nr:hypothetical protein [Pyrinomonadaceae bacterium]
MKTAPTAAAARHLSLATLLVALAVGSGACGARRTPDLERIFERARTSEGKRPVIVIPGILGSRLVNRRTGEVVWPSAFRSSDDGLALPVSPDLSANGDDLVASEIIEKAKLARLAPDVYVYYELLDALARFGNYREGDWDAPSPGGDRDTFYVFAYDWRRDNAETARELVGRVEELKRKLGRPDLKFNVIAHSMGGLVARYAAMYGDADLPAEGATPRPDWAGSRHLAKIFMFGTPNEGSAEAFATLMEGYSVTEGLRRRVRLLNKLSREDALTIPSLYQLLPRGAQAEFLDENLRPVAGIDLYDPETWRRYGWAAVNDARYRERFARGEVQDEEGPPLARSLEQLDSYFAAALRRARRFHAAIDADAQDAPVPLFVFGGDCEETLRAPVVLRDERRNVWLTLTSARSFRTSAGAKVERRDAVRAMYEPGDGRVTRRSLLGQRANAPRASALYDTPLPVAYAVFACDLHSDLQNNKILQNNALTLLVNELFN